MEQRDADRLARYFVGSILETYDRLLTALGQNASYALAPARPFWPGADVGRAAVYRDATGRAFNSRLILGPHWKPKPPRDTLKIDGIPTLE